VVWCSRSLCASAESPPICEQAGELRESQGAVGLSANDTRALRRRGLGDRVRAVTVVLPELIILSCGTGENIASQPIAPDGVYEASPARPGTACTASRFPGHLSTRSRAKA